MTAKLESAWKQNYSDTKPRNEGKRNTKKTGEKKRNKKKKKRGGRESQSLLLLLTPPLRSVQQC